jgi:putative pyruvate formate lyase activating enzyme
MGCAVDDGEFAAICLALQKRGAENINIVTGSHAIPAIACGLDTARKAGLVIPALWNTSSYESAEALDLLKDRIDMYLPDLKTLDEDIAARYFNAPDYPDRAEAAIRLMMDFRPGSVIIRHLMLPGFMKSTADVLRWFSENARGKAVLSLMTQYTPVSAPESAFGPRAHGKYVRMPDRFINREEYEEALRLLEEFGIDDGFYQELETGSEWLPDFTRQNPFSSELSTPVWHWQSGFLPV